MCETRSDGKSHITLRFFYTRSYYSTKEWLRAVPYFVKEVHVHLGDLIIRLYRYTLQDLPDVWNGPKAETGSHEYLGARLEQVDS